jgi:hypothetical protein
MDSSMEHGFADMHPDRNRIRVARDSFDHFANPAEESDDPPRRSGVTWSVYYAPRHPLSLAWRFN